MYFYAVIELETGICFDVMEVEEPITDDPSCIEIDSNDKSYMFRKKYVNGAWENTTPAEAQQFEGAHIGIHGEWLDDVINSKADINHTHDGYATTDHSHTGYVSSDDLQVLTDIVDTKADTNHSHTEYSPSNHTHDGYVTQVVIDTLAEKVDNKADVSHTHSEYVLTTDFNALEAVVEGKAEISHSHNNYSEATHRHDLDYSPLSHSHSASEIGAAPSTHSHSDYATISALDELSDTVSGKANVSHSHDDRYFTETEINTKLAGKSDTTHTHTGVYDVNGAAASALTSANAYTDTEIETLSGTVSTKANVADLNAHKNDTEVHITDAERNIWNAKSDFSGSYNDLTNKPTIPSINGLATEDYVDEKVDAVTVESIGALPNTTVIPTVPTNVSAFTNDAGYITEHQSLDGLATETYVNTQIDAIEIPDALSDLTTDSTHRLVTDTEKATWNAKSNFSGNYNDLTNKPSIPSISGLATETYVDEAVSVKANSSHTHTIGNVNGLQGALDAKSDSTHNHNSAYDVLGAANSALTSAQTYTDNAIDTLNETVVTKANASDLTSHTGNTTVHVNSTERNNWNTAKTHADSTHAPVNAEPNQNAFSNVVVGGTTISADTKTDTLTFVAGNNVTITPDSTGDSITISSANTVYTHPTTAGNKHIPAGGSNGQILRWSADGTVVWGNDNNTTYSNATQTTSGLMSNTDKTKLDGIAEGANNYTLPSAGTSLGGVKSGGDVTISSGVITVNDDSHNHVISNVDGLQSALDSKAASGHNHDGVYYTETEIDTLLEGKANSSHTHTISNITNLQSTLDGKANASHGTHVSYSTTAPVMDGTASVGTASTVARSDHKHPTDTSRAAQTSLDSHTSNKSNPHGVTLAQLGVTATAAELNILDGVTATTDEINYVDGVTSNIQTQLNAKASSSHTHSTATASASGLMSASDKSKLDGIASGANAYTLPTASSTLGGVKTTSTVTSNSGYTACPIIGGVPYYKDTNTTYNLGSFGVTATATELNALDGITATVTELNYVDGVTSNIQTQLNGKAASSHAHNYAGSSSAGGAATSANKLATARTISLAGDVTGSTSFDGSGNVSITTTVADDSHNHTIANVDNLQTTLDGKASASHTHSADALIQMADALFATNSGGGVEYSYGSGSGKNVLTEISNMPQGFHTVYAIAGTTGNPETAESYRYFIHKTSTTIGWIWAFGADGSIYSNYLAGANTYKGWKTIHDAKRKPLWIGSYYMTAGHTATPSKKLSECEHGWMLLWSDYDPDTGTVNDTDFCTTMIPNRNWAGNTWNGAAYYCDVPRYTAGTATDSESRIIKVLNVYDNKLVGTANNNAAPRNDVILRAVYEF